MVLFCPNSQSQDVQIIMLCKVRLTDAFAVFKEGQSSMPGVQVNAYDGSLTKP